MSLIDKPKVKILMLKGEKGDSAYQVAVNNGYTGTEEEWKDSYINAETYYNKTEVDTKLKKKVYYFDTVDLMKSSTNLVQGDMIITKGYYENNDGGSGEYEIVDDETLSDDGGLVHKLSNGLYAKLLNNTNKYNLLSLGLSTTIDKSQSIQNIVDSLGDNITLYLPDGTYILNLIIKNKHVTITGKGTIKGSITIDTTIIDNVLEESYNEINGIRFTKGSNDYAIKLNTGRNFKIDNINIDNTFTYGIYYNQESTFSQRVSKIMITNNYIYSDYNVYLVDTATLANADISFSDNHLYANVCNVYLDGVDGFKDNNNTYFMSGHDKQSVTKTYNFYANRINWLTINGSTLFEAGLESIHLTKYQNVNITNNLIGWCGQRVRSSGIYLGDYDITGNGLYNITSVSNNIINAPSLHGIECTTNTGRISITNNRIHNAGSSQYYYGETDTTQAYAINYPLVNENMYCNVSNNICENRENNISSRIFKINNTTNSSKSSAYRLTEEISISDTFTANSSKSKTLSYTLPTGYVVNNIRVKTMNPTSHAVQYDITLVGGIAIIRNNYSSDLTTTINFEVEYVKQDSFI